MIIFEDTLNKLEDKLFFFIMKKINNTPKSEINICISGGKSLVRLYKKINLYPRIFSKINIFLTDERLATKDKKNISTINKIIKNKKIFINDLFTSKSNNLNYLIIKNFKNIKNPDLCILGMGNDGHYASIFYNTVNKKKNKILITKHNGEKFNRITVSKNLILSSNILIIIANSLKKKEILLKKELDLPIHQLIQNYKKKLFIFLIHKKND